MLQWMMFLDNPENKEVDQIMEENEDIKEAKDELDKISQDDLLRRMALKADLAKRDHEQLMYEAKRDGTEQGFKIGHEEGVRQGLKEGREKGLKEGREQGLEQGREQGLTQGREEGERRAKLETAKKLREEGIPLDIIIKATGLTEKEIMEGTN